MTITIHGSHVMLVYILYRSKHIRGPMIHVEQIHSILYYDVVRVIPLKSRIFTIIYSRKRSYYMHYANI